MNSPRVNADLDAHDVVGPIGLPVLNPTKTTATG